MIARNRVVGVINVQHRQPHQHTGSEMELLTTVGEQVGCALVLARMEPTAIEAANHVELVLSSATRAVAENMNRSLVVALTLWALPAMAAERWRLRYSY